MANRVRPLLAVSVLCCVLGAATPAWAGGYAVGYGETIEEATRMALASAEAIVRSRGKGCVGPGKDGKNPGLIRPEKLPDGLWKIEAHYNHHNGSCGRTSSISDQLRELGIDF